MLEDDLVIQHIVKYIRNSLWWLDYASVDASSSTCLSILKWQCRGYLTVRRDDANSLLHPAASKRSVGAGVVGG